MKSMYEYNKPLDGDFSILSEFEKIKIGFGALLMKAISYPDGHPIKKAKMFDISWVEDIKTELNFC